MSVSRRFFLVGAGALVTAGFVSKAVAHAERTGRPLLVTPDRAEGELFVYSDGRISFGPFELEDNEPVPTWRQYLTEKFNKPIRTATDLVGTIYPDIPEEDFDISVDDDFWADTWE